MEEDDIVAGWAERIARASEAGTPLRIRGGGTKDWYGQTLQGEILDTRAYRGIIAYDPAELVITARSGTPLAEIEAALRQHGQMLPFEPPTSAAMRRSAAASRQDSPDRAARGRARRAISCWARSS